MERLLYFDCSTGISGDMAVAAMIGLGADAGRLRGILEGLGLGIAVGVSEVERSGVRAVDFDVVLEEDNRDHDVAYLYGHDAPAAEGHGAHRTPADIAAIIDGSGLTDGAKAVARRILDILADAEAEAHGISREEVHFHEVGAADSVADIIALAFCIDDLGIEDVCFSDLTDGTGTVRCRHGIIPVPVPAVVSIARAHGLRLSVADRKGEYVTPTGAAFAAAVGNSERPPSFRIDRVGTGAGKRDQEVPGLLRAMVLDTTGNDTVLRLECNVDDSTGESLGYAMERLFATGAKEVNYSPVYMKKNRPGWLLTVICDERRRPALEDVIFRETTTIGIRRCTMERTVLDRAVRRVDTPWGRVRVKVCSGPGFSRGYPEYDDVSQIARANGVPFEEVYRAAIRASGLRRDPVQVREDEHPHALPEVPEPEPGVVEDAVHDLLAVHETGPADTVEEHGDEELLRMGGGAVEALRQPAAHVLRAPVGGVGEPGHPLGGDVVGHDGCEDVAVPEVVDVVDADVGPLLGDLRDGGSLGSGDDLAERLVVAHHGVLDELEEDVLLGLDVPVQVGAGP